MLTFCPSLAVYNILGTIFSVTVTLLWLVVASGTLWRVWTGEIIVAPCLKEAEEKEKMALEARRQSSSIDV